MNIDASRQIGIGAFPSKRKLKNLNSSNLLLLSFMDKKEVIQDQNEEIM